jgi:hypothetical protein
MSKHNVKAVLLPLFLSPLSGHEREGENTRIWSQFRKLAEQIRLDDIFCAIFPPGLDPVGIEEWELLKEDQREWLYEYNNFSQEIPWALQEEISYLLRHYWHYGKGYPPDRYINFLIKLVDYAHTSYIDIFIIPVTAKTTPYLEELDSVLIKMDSSAYRGIKSRIIFVWLDDPEAIPVKFHERLDVIDFNTNYEYFLKRIRDIDDRFTGGKTKHRRFFDAKPTASEKPAPDSRETDKSAPPPEDAKPVPPAHYPANPATYEPAIPAPGSPTPAASGIPEPNGQAPAGESPPPAGNQPFSMVGGDLVSKGSPAPEPAADTQVFLGVSTPLMAATGEEFTARFAAYTDLYKLHVATILDKEAPASQKILDAKSCQWKVGTKVRVQLSAKHLTVHNSKQEFTWNGQWEILHFDVEVPADCQAEHTVLKFDVFVFGLQMITLRPEMDIARAAIHQPKNKEQIMEARAPRTAFASYATKDRKNVLSRVRSLQIYTGLDVFFDCLSINPGEQWKQKILTEIQGRDIFWLFWSRHAMRSQWVDWEWRAALKNKTLQTIQPHPLEPVEVAPAPKELEDLQFGTAYECYLSSLQEPKLTSMQSLTKKLSGFFRQLLNRWRIAPNSHIGVS